MILFFFDQYNLLALLSNLNMFPCACHVFKVVHYITVLAPFNMGAYGKFISGVRPENAFGRHIRFCITTLF
jgi:hypothetical protein